MLDSTLISIHRVVTRHRRMVLFALLLLLALSVIRLPFITFDNNIERMLPASPPVQRGLRFLRQSGLSGKVILSVSLPTDHADPTRLTAAVDDLAAALKGDLVTGITSGLPQANAARELVQFVQNTPQLISTEELDGLEHTLTTEAIDQRIGTTYRRLITGSGGIMRDLLLADPLGLAASSLSALQSVAASFGYRVKIVQGHLLSEDETHALLVLTTPVRITDGFGSRALLQHIDACVARSPFGIRACVIAGHRHTIGNEDAIRYDVRRICIVAAIGFLVLFLLIFRDWRAGIVLLMPVFAILVAIAVSSLFLGALSYFIVGMSAVLVGIAVDYAIHVYVGKRTGGDPAVALLTRPITAGAVTTISVFIAFYFSSASGYRQLAWFSIIGLVTCLLLSLFVLPSLVKTTPGAEATWKVPCLVVRTQRGRYRLIGAWLLLLAGLAAASTTLVFEHDISELDGSGPQVRQDEEQFNETWGGRNQPGVLVVEGSALESVLEKNDDIALKSKKLIGAGALTTLAPIWPSEKTRQRHQVRWQAFWQAMGPRITARLEAATERYGFAKEAFQPFLTWARDDEAQIPSPPTAIIDNVKDRFLHVDGDMVQAMSYFEDTDENVQGLSSLTTEGHPSVYLVSRRALARSISQSVSRESRRLMLIAAALILVVLFAMVRNVRLALLALTPVGTAIVSMLGVLAILKMPLSAAAIIAAMVVVGLCIDYGIFMVHSEHQRIQCGTALSVTLSAVTTLVGSAPLLLAHHPVMHAIGVTLVSGVVSGYLCALWVLPTLYTMVNRETRA